MDTIWGTPSEIFDGDTFELIVTHYDRYNENTYKGREKARIKGLDDPQLWSINGQRTKSQLEHHIMGVELRVDVLGRDEEGYLLVGLSLEQE